MIKRGEYKYLLSWMKRKDRKPLIIRGARQVGKTFLVRELGREFPHFLEFNFDETPWKESLFKGDIDQVISYLEADSGKRIIPGKTLLFLDEIQAAPEILPRLRYFYEKVPDLHVIAAGSLLEFLLKDHDFSMPVGRVEYLFLGPVPFKEYLQASEDFQLADLLENYSVSDPLPEALHQRLLQHLQHYSIIGGMPEALASWIDNRDILSVGRIQTTILQTYSDDFTKYRHRIEPELLRLLLLRIPRLVGRKFRYVHIDEHRSPRSILEALSALESAGIISLVHHSDGNGVPLGAEISMKKFKPLFLDIGLYSSSLGLRLSDIKTMDDLMLVHKGALAEQFIGQHLYILRNPWEKPGLYYWQRNKKGSSAEVDYLFNLGIHIIPIEVKAGKTGTIRSLHTFMGLKQAALGVRFYRNLPSVDSIDTTIQRIGRARYTLISLPLYMVSETERLIQEYL